MKLIDILTDFFSQSKEQTKDKTPEGVCELCWGYERYDGQIREIFEDKQIDVNSHRDRYMLIQEFVINHIDGQRLIKAQTKKCDECKSKAD